MPSRPRRAERRGPGPGRISVLGATRHRVPRAFVLEVVRAALRHGGRPDAEVSVLLTDDAGIADLHGRFLGDPTPTDVMSFALDDGIDLVVSVPCARREARRRGHRWRDELALYLVHGVLHACGHDDHATRARARMRRAERAILATLALQVARFP